MTWKPGSKVVFPNPKTSGNGRYTYLPAYAYALGTNGKDDPKARAFVGKVLGNVPVFDTGGRGATTTFVERQIGDVLITFESEIDTIRHEYQQAGLQVVYPSVSVRADFSVAVVDAVVKRHGTRGCGSLPRVFVQRAGTGDSGEALQPGAQRGVSSIMLVPARSCAAAAG